MKRSASLSLVLIGALSGCSAFEICEFARDVYETESQCRSDWVEDPLACETFADVPDPKSIVTENATATLVRFYGPAYTVNQRPASIQTPYGIKRVGSNAMRTDQGTVISHATSGISADGQIVRGGFGRCGPSSGGS